MRTIKFRGKQIDNYKWVYGYYHLAHANEHKIYELGYVNTTPYELVVSESVGQSTGLFDSNNVEIFEGDIIEHYAFFGYVLFENGMFSMSSSANTNFCECKQPMAYHNASEMKVVGNIFDNADLVSF